MNETGGSLLDTARRSRDLHESSDGMRAQWLARARISSITTVLAGSDFVTGDGTDCVVAARSVFVAGTGCGGGATVSVASLVAGAVTAGGAAGAG